MDLCFLVPSLAQVRLIDWNLYYYIIFGIYKSPTFRANVSDCFQPLSMRNYEDRFSALLHAEEVQMELEMREFDLKQVCTKIEFRENDFDLACDGWIKHRWQITQLYLLLTRTN